eukprot:PhF_6_TR9487/c0_g1_i1/m.14801/K20535/MPK1_2; mitogen-activated protein kinase 1/2
MSTESSKKVTGPVDMGNGRKYYMVNNSRFEVDNKYSVVRPIGFGAYGLVCSATIEGSTEKVAIKKIPKVFDDLVDGKRILRELKLLSFLRHPCVLPVRDVFRATDRKTFEDVYFVSPLFDTDLHQIIKSKQPLTDDHFQYFMYQTLAGLKYVHSADVLHRDLKPGNLLVNADCQIVICDFGLARGNDESAQFTEYVVTRWYRAPELLLMSQRYTFGVDMWSVGCIFGEMMRRKPLFQGKDYINQLKLVTDMLGTPSPADLPEVTSPEALRFLSSLEKKKQVPLAEAFPCANPLALDLLQRMLCLDSSKRITAAEALKHPYFTKMTSSSVNTEDAHGKFSWELDNDELTEPQLRAGLWDEMCKYHPE